MFFTIIGCAMAVSIAGWFICKLIAGCIKSFKKALDD